MKNKYVSLVGILFCLIGLFSVLCVEEIHLHCRCFGEGRWLALTGYLSSYAGIGIAATTGGIAFVLASVLKG